MKKFLFILIITALPTVGFAKKDPLPTDEAGLRVLAEKGKKEAMYELACLLDNVELVMDLEGFTVTPSPSVERTREAYYWYKRVEETKLNRVNEKAAWKLFCLLIRPREGIDEYPSQLLRENKAYYYYGRSDQNPEYWYFRSLLCYYGSAYFNFHPNSDFREYIGGNQTWLSYTHMNIKYYFKKAESSHPLYTNAEVILAATKAAYEAETDVSLGDVLSLAGTLVSVGQLSQSGSLLELTQNLNNLAEQTATPAS